MSHVNQTNIEKIFTQLEQVHFKLSDAAMYPFIGSLPAVAKVVLGLIEIVVAAIFFVLALIPSIFSKTARSLLAFSALHIGRGLIRTAVGSVLVVPILGSIFICGLDRITSDCALTIDNSNTSGDGAHACIFG
jgi:hypothetical protein